MAMRLFKRGKTWYIEFKRGSKRSLGTGDEREARRLFKIAKAEYLKGKLVQLDTERVSVQEFVDQYLETRFDVAELTLKKDRFSFNVLLECVPPNLPLKAFGEKEISKLKMVCLAKGIKKVSINSYLRHIRTGLNWAFKNGMIEKPIEIELLKLPDRLPRTLTRSESNLIRSYALKNDFELYRMIEFALWTGCRREEILRLTWPDMKGDHVRIIGKGGKERVIPLLGGAIEAAGEGKDIGPVFEPMHIDTITHRFKKIARACGMEDVTFHTLRHSSATRMVESGIRLEIIQKILGHSDISTTKIYAKIFDQVVWDEMGKLKL